jgi:UPF0176 protein
MSYRSLIVDQHSGVFCEESDCQKIWILSYYHFAPIEDPAQFVQQHFEFFADTDCKGRIYIATQGVNGTLSAPPDQAKRFMKWLMGHPLFENVEFKVQEAPEHVFARLTVKVKKELVALGHESSFQEISLKERGTPLSPSEWKKMLEEEPDALLLDIRNDYEWVLGHFDGAINPKCETFRDFTQLAEEVTAKVGTSKTKVMMYCTGGIRCEFFSALLKQHGVENVYSLDGGIIKYGIYEKSAHWLGKLFVFDDRLSTAISDEEAPPIAKCHHCGHVAENYYNCANMDCNELFLCCSSCLEQFRGCCKRECASGTRVRPYKLSNKPFRRWYEYAKSKDELNTLTANKEVVC